MRVETPPKFSSGERDQEKFLMNQILLALDSRQILTKIMNQRQN